MVTVIEDSYNTFYKLKFPIYSALFYTYHNCVSGNMGRRKKSRQGKLCSCTKNAIIKSHSYFKRQMSKTTASSSKGSLIKQVSEALIISEVSVTGEQWKKCVDHCVEIENYYRESEKIQDAIDPVVINFESDSSEESSESDNSSSTDCYYSDSD